VHAPLRPVTGHPVASAVADNTRLFGRTRLDGSGRCATLKRVHRLFSKHKGTIVNTSSRSLLASVGALLTLPGLVLISPAGATTTAPGDGAPTSPPGTGESVPDTTSVEEMLSETSNVAGAVPVTAESEVVEMDEPVTAGAGAEEVVVTAKGGDLRVVGVTWAELDAGDNLTVRLRSHDGQAWSGWSDMDITRAVTEEEAPEGSRGGTEPMVVTDAETIEVALSAPVGELPRDPQLDVIDPGESPADSGAPIGQDVVGDGAGAGQFAVPAAVVPGTPSIYSRADWGADETVRQWKPQLGEVTGVVVHHSASSNSYTAGQVPGIIRGFYQYHAVTRGWGDIGYNVIVDKFGRAWEGRYGGLTNPVIGAHASGVNDTTFGISVIGNYDVVQVPKAAFDKVAQVTAWKFAISGITTSGTAKGINNAPMKRVVGHRDVGQTACPGRYFYSRLGELTTLITSKQSGMTTVKYPGYDSVRLSGHDRYATSVAASGWSNSWAGNVFVATGQDYADALAGGPAATVADGPVLLTQPGGIPGSVAGELKRLTPRKIYVLGGRGAISDTVVRQLGAYAPVERLQGSDRYETAAAVGRKMWTDPSKVSTVYLASGQVFADALSGGAAAAKQRAPMYLTQPGGLPTATRLELQRLNPAKVVVLGGTGAVGSKVVDDVRRALPNVQIQRLSGKDRYATSAAIADAVWPNGASDAYFATGAAYADALSGVPSAGDDNAPMLLVRRTCTDEVVRSTIGRLGADARITLGGTGAIADGAVGRRC
jgi:putative cell wall-binding protein